MAMIVDVVTVGIVVVWAVALAPFRGTAFLRGFLVGVTSVVSGAYFLVGPLLFGDLYGVTFSPMFFKMFLENLGKIRNTIFVFLLNFYVL
jgi:hypothetical protein